MTAPSPREFENEVRVTLAVVQRELKAAVRAYRDAWDAGHTTAVRGSDGRVAHGVSDPTAGVVGDPLDRRRPGAQAGIRAACERAAHRLATIDNAATSIRPDIARAMDRLDPPETFEPVIYPRTVTRAELEESRAIQQRRAADG